MAISQKFPNGTPVRHKSGGPVMIIDSFVDGSHLSYMCSWFENDILKRGDFGEDSIEEVKSNNGPKIISTGPGGIMI